MNPEEPESPQPVSGKNQGNHNKGIERVKHMRGLDGSSRARKSKPAADPFGDDPDPAHLVHHARPFLTNLAARNYTPRTVERTEMGIKRFLDWTLERGILRADEITLPILESYQAWLWRYRKANGKPMATNTQATELIFVKHYFRWLVRQRVILSNPASELELPRLEKRLPPEALSLRQTGAIMSVPDITDPLGVRDRAMLELLYSTGIRRAEIAGVRVEDLHFERCTLRIRGKGKKERVVPIGARALHWIERYMEEVRPRLLIRPEIHELFLTGYGTGFLPVSIGKHFSAILRKADIAKGGPHLLRHTCATHMLEGGADLRHIQQLLGHTKADTTSLYAQVSITHLQLVHNRCHPAERTRSTNGANLVEDEEPTAEPPVDSTEEAPDAPR